MKKKEIKEKISEGWIRIDMLFELVGNPKEHVEQLLQSYMTNIKTDSGVLVINEDYGDAEEIGDGLFSTFVEADMLVHGLDKLTWLSFNFSPASIEIKEPIKFDIGAAELQNWVNDLLSKLHEVGAMSQQIASQNKLLVKNMNRVIKNSVMLCISLGFDTPKEIEDKTGIPYKQLKPFFEALMREGRLKLHENKYKKIETKASKPAKAKPKAAKKKPKK
ncbi:hypothetical protein ACFL1B_04825 [Nanoarchaeota archaeon]